MRILGIFTGKFRGHKVHNSWISAVSDNTTSFIPKPFYRLYDYMQRKPFLCTLSPLIHQPLSFIKGLFMKPVEIYLIEGTEAMPALFFKKGKIVLINDGPFFPFFKEYKGLKKLYAKWIVKRIDGIISSTYMMRKYSEKYTKVPNEVVYLYVDVGKYGKVKPHLHSQDVCCVAKPTFSKGTDILVDAFKIYRREFPDAKLYLCGEGPLRKKFSKVPGVVALGHCDPAKYLAKSGLYINSARIEPFGVNILESMCAGIPPLVSKYCGLAEVVKKIDPWLVTSLKPKEISEKAVILQNDISMKKKLGRKCRKVALTFTKEKSVREFTERFDKILKRPEMTYR